MANTLRLDMAKLLVVEDEATLQQSLSRGLTEEGHVVVCTPLGKEAVRIANAGGIDAVLLDLMLPDADGLQVLQELRQTGFVQPILIMTARDAVQDRIRGLDCGADDYLVKPFVFDELLAR